MKPQTTSTITLRSRGSSHAPTGVHIAIWYYRSVGKQKPIKFLIEEYGLTKRCATDLLSGKVEYHVVGDQVVFDYPVTNTKGGAK